LAHLGVNALAVRRNPRVAVFHAPDYVGDLCKGKGVCFQRPNFLT
jgi:hypothetical protein